MTSRPRESFDRKGHRLMPSAILTSEEADDMRRRLDLSPRQFQVALACLDGISRAQTARRLSCSVHTVDSHLRRVFSKLRVESRGALAARLMVAYVESNRTP